jgi:lipopolysaccharide export system ATP-binding protein
MHLLEVRGLAKIYGRRRVVDGVAFHVNAGEVVGLLGPNGAGKTTSFRMATGQITPNAGQVWFNGEDVTHLPMYRRARLGMGYLSQETSVFRKLTVEQNLLAILEIMPAMRTLGRKLTKKERLDRTDQVLEQFGLTRLRKNNASRLSGGEKRRLEIARCLICEPLLILLDEPFTGIDPKTIADIQDIVRDLRAQGIGVLLTDHNVREALKITTRSYLIKDGKVRTHGTPLEIINDPIAIDEYLGKGFNEPALGAPSYTTPSRSPEYAAPQPPRGSIAGDSEPATSDRTPARDPEPVLHSVLEQEKIHRLVEGLKSPDQAHAAAELTRRGTATLSALLSALERRDVEMRRQALQVMQAILKRPVIFDPYAPEMLRKQQLAALREQYERKAG